MLAAQGSLLDSATEPSYDPAFATVIRTDLGRGAWLDVVSGWLTGAETLLDRVLEAAPWAAHERWMYDKVVAEPRLSTRGWVDPPDPVLGMAEALGRRYELDLSAVSANLYRDGRDSVAWHGDTAGRRVATTVVAILVLGSPRRFLPAARRGCGLPVDAGVWRPARDGRHLPADVGARRSEMRRRRGQGGPDVPRARGVLTALLSGPPGRCRRRTGRPYAAVRVGRAGHRVGPASGWGGRTR